MRAPRRNIWARWGVSFLLLLVLIGFAAWKLGLFHRVAPDEVTLDHVADGDTIVVKDSTGHKIKVRLIGVDAPELGTAASFQSALFTARLCEKAREIKLEPEPTRSLDKYGRVLGWVWLTLPDGKRLLLNHELIHSGNAHLYRPTSTRVKYFDQLR